MKRTLIFLMAAMLVLTAGCGKKNDTVEPDNPPASSQAESGTEAQKPEQQPAPKQDKAENKQQPAPKQDKAENKQQPAAPAPAQDNTDAPEVSSMEELTDMINEFNSAEEGERKEELRTQLEKILEQAGAQAQ